ncbi:hypothetical protein AMAG_19072 [Allomyces macrogynus ATCC 38327]|uniref:Uncharacterized protein n=1 Tax=Allomyces macrogynus (strain ATCC 38327) TaxID=578462 RepID=A0A0L0SN73_ALLM3|nr:hypothetical protein AMAG_19072 [Allomyces macrogynus ATCC 38327]|eukprot:KNE63840.1 hypothetical protein AMAG_19072 [Allomyces macrogynus ATCC 38327]
MARSGCRARQMCTTRKRRIDDLPTEVGDALGFLYDCGAGHAYALLLGAVTDAPDDVDEVTYPRVTGVLYTQYFLTAQPVPVRGHDRGRGRGRGRGAAAAGPAAAAAADEEGGTTFDETFPELAVQMINDEVLRFGKGCAPNHTFGLWSLQ